MTLFIVFEIERNSFCLIIIFMSGFNYRSRGNVGEDLAVSCLEHAGYEIVERNATFL